MRGKPSTRRRIQLGSGLDLRKLADSIDHIVESAEQMALICDSPRFPDAWVHLSKRCDPSDSGSLSRVAWVLTVGYPQQDDPLRTLKAVGCQLPNTSLLLAWEQGIYARVALPEAASSIEIAVIIECIMIGLHRIAAPSDVELALESQQ